jgi:hypothetical protein
MVKVLAADPGWDGALAAKRIQDLAHRNREAHGGAGSFRR